ncbi:MAG: hypothetical protein CL623_01695 [Arcobacter sp.]|nr:hypothetical protein [Arcobacter sp.]|tara:strand:- start:17175 stop:17654 length:480 start_codon:yes stop_codon:yes gene_type:complete
MFKLFMILSVFMTLVLSNEVKFNETKYINAVDLEVSKKGILVFDKIFTKLSYENEETSFKFQVDNILQIKDDKETILSYDENLELSIFSTLINAIYKDDLEKLEEFFEIKKEKEETVLIPDDHISSVIDKITYKKTAKNLDFLNIYFTNEDRINIVQTK